MAKPNKLLAQSLSVLAKLQKAGRHVFPSKDLPRMDRQRLQKAGFIQEVLRGWYLPSKPDEQPGDSAAWYAGMREFVAGYCNERFGQAWHVSPDQSLMFLTGDRTVPRQMQIWAPRANNQPVQLRHGCSIFLYRAPSLCESAVVADAGDLRLATPASALVYVGPGFYTQQPLAARIAVTSLDDLSAVLRPLLDGGHAHIAGRLAGALRALGRTREADEIVRTMQAAGMTVQESNPFAFVVAARAEAAGRPESPHVQRIRLMRADMRQAVIDAFPPPARLRPNVRTILAQVEARYVTDAYHSLSIEGYRVTPELIEKVRSGSGEPDGADAQARDAMAARGYFEAHLKVKEYIAKTLRTRPDGWPLQEDLAVWHRALFGPSVTVGILRPSDLAGWRNDQVFIRGALHVPVSKGAVRECMPVLFELIASEPHAAVRATLGHFFFVFIHPYMDGNGRLARFIFNAMLVTGGYRWTIVPIERRNDYMQALEQASSYRDIRPLAGFFAQLVREQTNASLARPIR